MPKKKSYKAEDIFDTGFEFDYASACLLRDFGNNEMHAMNPLRVNEAFALELYLKCLIQITTKQKAQNKHQLKELYFFLPVETRDEIENIFSAQLIVKRMRTKPKIRKPLHSKNKFRFEKRLNYSIDQILTLSNNAFIESRYSYEYEIGLYYGLGYLKRAVRDYLIQLNPSWKNKIKPLFLI